MTDDIAFLPATELLARYRAKTLSPVEVTQATLQRLETYEGALNAFVLYDVESAMAAARASEVRWQKGAPQGLLDGVPLAIKDTSSQKVGRAWSARRRSTRTKAGTRMRRRLRGCAAQNPIFFGKTTTPEFGWKPTTDSPLTGVTRNPWNTERTPGRQQRRQRRGVGRGHLSARGRHRRRRLDPHPGLIQRRVWAEADLWPGSRLPALGIWRRVAYRADDAARSTTRR